MAWVSRPEERRAPQGDQLRVVENTTARCAARAPVCFVPSSMHVERNTQPQLGEMGGAGANDAMGNNVSVMGTLTSRSGSHSPCTHTTLRRSPAAHAHHPPSLSAPLRADWHVRIVAVGAGREH